MRARYSICLFVLLASAKAFSCLCGGPNQAKTMRDVAEWYAARPDVDLIFEGKVVKQEVRNGSVGAPSGTLSMTPEGQHRVVEFKVTRIFRGRHLRGVSVITGLGTGDCGYVFWPEETYLVYASSLADGMWFTSICNGTNTVEDSGTAIRFLAHKKPTADDLLSPEDYAKQYSEKVLPKRTGSVCGQVLMPDGSPLKGARVALWELREDDLPARGGSDPNTSSDTGHFCVRDVPPGRYFLSAESSDYEHRKRYVGSYPGVSAQTEGVQLSIKPGIQLPDVKFTTIHETVYGIRIHVVTPDKTQLSYKNGCRVAVDSEDRNPFSYHISNTLREDGSVGFGYIPPGKYLVTTHCQPNLEGGELKPFPESKRWKPARQEVVVRGDTDVVLQMEPASAN